MLEADARYERPIAVLHTGAHPVSYNRTVGWVQTFTASHYGYGFEDITAFIWWLIVALLIFFFARASISTALVMGGLAIAALFL